MRLINAGFLPKLDELLRNSELKVRRLAGSVLVGICAEGREACDMVLASGILRTVVDIIQCSGDRKVAKEAVWVLSYCSSHCSDKSVLLDMDTVQLFWHVLNTNSDPEVVGAALLGLSAMLDYCTQSQFTRQVSLTQLSSKCQELSQGGSLTASALLSCLP